MAVMRRVILGEFLSGLYAMRSIRTPYTDEAAIALIKAGTNGRCITVTA